MNFSFHPKYKTIAKEIKEFVINKNLHNLKLNLIVGGDGSFFVYKDKNLPNYLICSKKYSKGHYASSWFEDDWKNDLIKYSQNQKKYQTLIETIEVEIDNEVLPEVAINEVMLGQDYCFKAIVDGKKIYDTGIMIYTPNGNSGWANEFNAIKYENELGIIRINQRKSIKLEDELIVKSIDFHSFKILFDGKGDNLKNDFNSSCSNRNINEIFLKPYTISSNQKIKIRKGKEIIIVKI